MIRQYNASRTSESLKWIQHVSEESTEYIVESHSMVDLHVFPYINTPETGGLYP